MAEVLALTGGTPANLGSIAPVPATLAYQRQQWGFSDDARPADEFIVSITALLPIESSVVEALEELRQGRDFTLQITSKVLIVDRGLAPSEPHDAHPVAPQDIGPVMGHVDTLQISQGDWGRVLQDWNRGVGIPLIVPLVQVMPDAVRAEIVRHLGDAWRRIGEGDYRGSMAASRKALELLRELSPVQGTLPASRERTVDQRLHAVLNSLFDLASASAHTDAPVKDYVPMRADAVALVAATAAMAQDVFARA